MLSAWNLGSSRLRKETPTLHSLEGADESTPTMALSDKNIHKRLGRFG
eukprot:SAG31_NODE_21186_length_555_cov_4.951754_1_plen_47_part_01